MNSKDELLQALASATSEITGRMLVMGMAMEEVMRSLPSAARSTIAANLRTNVGQVLEEQEDPTNHDMESSATLQLAALLEALGQPPKM